MKRLLLILICFLFCRNCIAQEMPIQLYHDYNDDRVKDKRSLSMEPTVSHDRNVIYIHSDIVIENMQITGEKEFTIELSYKDINLQGHFTID